MAHFFNNLGRNTTFASKKEIAWHGLGKVVDAMTSKEAIELGGMNFEVEKRPNIYMLKNPVPTSDFVNHDLITRTKIKEGNLYFPSAQSPDSFTMVRTDTEHAFGAVGKRYEPIQNWEAFDFFDSIIGQGHAQYETVGALGMGEVVFITAKLPDYIEVAKEQIDKYLLLTMSHDGSSAITVMFTPIRVVCNNTLSMALNSSRNKITIKHTKKARERLELAKQVLGLQSLQTDTMRAIWSDWAEAEIKDEIALEVFEAALGLTRDEKNNLTTKSLNKLNAVENYYFAGVGQNTISGTKWGVYNAITGYLQNVKEYKNDDIKFNNSFLAGDSTSIRQKTAELLMNI